MQVKRIVSSEEIKQNKDRVALQYGPIVYAIEDVDNPNAKSGLIIPENTSFEVQYQPELLGGTNTIKFKAPIAQVNSQSGQIETVEKSITAIPYFLWNNRGKSPMQIWVPERINTFKIN